MLYRWAYNTSIFVPMKELGAEVGGGLIIHHGLIIRTLRYMPSDCFLLQMVGTCKVRRGDSVRKYYNRKVRYFYIPLPTNDAPMRHDLSELSISLWEFIWGVNTRCYTSVHDFCLF